MAISVHALEDSSDNVPLSYWCCYVPNCNREPYKKVKWKGSIIALCRPHHKEFEIDPNFIVEDPYEQGEEIGPS